MLEWGPSLHLSTVHRIAILVSVLHLISGSLSLEGRGLVQGPSLLLNTNIKEIKDEVCGKQQDEIFVLPKHGET